MRSDFGETAEIRPKIRTEKRNRKGADAEKKEIKKVDFSRKACYNHHESGKYIRMYFFCEAKKIHPDVFVCFEQKAVLWRSPEFCPKSKKEKGQ